MENKYISDVIIALNKARENGIVFQAYEGEATGINICEINNTDSNIYIGFINLPEIKLDWYPGYKYNPSCNDFTNMNVKMWLVVDLLALIFWGLLEVIL